MSSQCVKCGYVPYSPIHCARCGASGSMRRRFRFDEAAALRYAAERLAYYSPDPSFLERFPNDYVEGYIDAWRRACAFLKDEEGDGGE
jgi:hypothetical protein